ncbi:hypothetical protein ZIOFF_075315 [Zingiber officinale]|uniref:STAR protein homodimerisation region domain-containing protein n=1 Tax=Zingiber officinale TaxID=94328 RepID=A0A8J5BV49_ZINOF|nr:hypothetical protein ZIOFF_075315 [Zingiber officinale]
MDERIPPPGYFHYSPSGVHSSPSPHHSMRPSAATSDRERYLAELLAERQKLGPFLQILPFCYRLLNQEILRASAFISNPSFIDHERIEHASPLRLTGHPFNGGPMDLEARSGMHTEENEYLHRVGVLPASSPGWGGTPGLAKSLVKKVVRLDVPVDKFPHDGDCVVLGSNTLVTDSQYIWQIRDDISTSRALPSVQVGEISFVTQ